MRSSLAKTMVVCVLVSFPAAAEVADESSSSSASRLELSREQLVSIIDQAASKTLEVKPLAIYPTAKKYTWELKITNLVNGESTENKGTATQKYVGGKYIVQDIKLPRDLGHFYYVITYDPIARTYVKWRVTKNVEAPIDRFMGAAEPATKTIAWVIAPKNGHVWMTFDMMTQREIRFVELVCVKGELRTRYEGKFTAAD